MEHSKSLDCKYPTNYNVPVPMSFSNSCNLGLGETSTLFTGHRNSLSFNDSLSSSSSQYTDMYKSNKNNNNDVSFNDNNMGKNINVDTSENNNFEIVGHRRTLSPFPGNTKADTLDSLLNFEGGDRKDNHNHYNYTLKSMNSLGNDNNSNGNIRVGLGLGLSPENCQEEQQQQQLDQQQQREEDERYNNFQNHYTSTSGGISSSPPSGTNSGSSSNSDRGDDEVDDIFQLLSSSLSQPPSLNKVPPSEVSLVSNDLESRNNSNNNKVIESQDKSKEQQDNNFDLNFRNDTYERLEGDESIDKEAEGEPGKKLKEINSIATSQSHLSPPTTTTTFKLLNETNINNDSKGSGGPTTMAGSSSRRSSCSLPDGMKENEKTKKKCSTIYLGGSNDIKFGYCSSSFQKLACSNLRCTQCDFHVLMIKNTKWSDELDYMFLRNNMPSLEKLRPMLEYNPLSLSSSLALAGRMVTKDQRQGQEQERKQRQEQGQEQCLSDAASYNEEHAIDSGISIIVDEKIKDEEVNLPDTSHYVAYGCQCSSKSVNTLEKLPQLGMSDIRWCCAGHYV